MLTNLIPEVQWLWERDAPTIKYKIEKVIFELVTILDYFILCIPLLHSFLQLRVHLEINFINQNLH